MPDDAQGMPIGKIQVQRIPSASRPVIYANNTIVTGNQWDFQMYFSLIHEVAPGTMGAVEEVLIIMTPEHALAFSKALQRTLATFTKEQGEIREVALPEPEPPAMPASKE